MYEGGGERMDIFKKKKGGEMLKERNIYLFTFNKTGAL